MFILVIVTEESKETLRLRDNEAKWVSSLLALHCTGENSDLIIW